MKHKHHIIPRYEGGSDDSENLVSLTPIQHSMWHFAEWLRKGDYRDYCAHKLILGDTNNPEFRRATALAFTENRVAGWRVWIEANPHKLTENGVKGNKKQREVLQQKGRTIAEKQWVIITPTGDELHITNLAKFCRENNLSKSHLCGVAKGIRKHHKGFTAHRQ